MPGIPCGDAGGDKVALHFPRVANQPGDGSLTGAVPLGAAGPTRVLSPDTGRTATEGHFPQQVPVLGG